MPYKDEKTMRCALFSKSKHLGIHWESIESPETSPGTPDVEGCFGGETVRIELKCCKGNKVRFNPTQPSWHIRRAQAGGRSWILSFRAGTKIRPDRMYLWPSSDVLLVDSRGYSAPAMHVWEEPFDWEKIAVIIFTEDCPSL